MTRILTSIHLSDIQKEVLAKVKAAPNTTMAWEEIIGVSADVDNNYAAARDVLGNLGLLKVGDGELEVTQKGEEVMKDSNLIDDMGELTDVGRELASNNTQQAQQSAQPNPPAEDNFDMGGGDMDGNDMGGMGDFSLESISLIRELNQRILEEDAMARIQSKKKS